MAEVTGFSNIVWVRDIGGIINLGQSLDSADCYIETKDLDLGKENYTKFLQAIYAKIEGIENAPTLYFVIYWRDRLSRPLSDSGHILFNGEEFKPVRPPGAKFYRIRIGDTAISTKWRLTMLELFGIVGGKRM